MTGPNTPNTPDNPIDDIKISNDDLQRITYRRPRGAYSVGTCKIPAGEVEIRGGRGQNEHQIRVDNNKGTLYEIGFQLFGKGVTDVTKTKYYPDQDGREETMEWTSEEISQILADIAKEQSVETQASGSREISAIQQQVARDSVKASLAADRADKLLRQKQANIGREKI